MIGIIIASFVSTIVLNNQNKEYWRICYIIGGITALFGYFLRTYKTEALSLSRNQLLSLYSIGGIKTLLTNKMMLTKVAVVSGFSYMTYSVPFIIINNLVPLFTDLTIQDLMPSNNAILIMDMMLIPIIGMLLLKFETKNILLFSTITLATTILPIWYFMLDASLYYVIFVKIWIVIIGVIFTCVINLWLNNLISTKDKYLIIGIGNAIGSSIIGKMAPALCLSIYYYTNSYFAPIWFVVVVALSTAWAVIT